MATGTLQSEEGKPGLVFMTRESCLRAMQEKYNRLNSLHCKPEWDQFTRMCWGPTPAGQMARLPCPDDGFLNPQQFATRRCMPNGQWFVNQTFDKSPYTNFEDCFLPVDLSAEEDLKKLVDEKVIFILKSMDEYKESYVMLYATSIVILLAATFLCAGVLFKLRYRRPENLSYIILVVASVSLLISTAVTLLVSAVDDATKVFKCRTAKSLVQFCTLVLYECILLYIFLYIETILQLIIRPMFLKIAIAGSLTLTALLILIELLLETFTFPTKFCGFRTLQSGYHWFTTALRVLLIMLHVCLSSVTVFGSLCLKHPHLEDTRELLHIRQKAICVLVFVLYNVVLEVLSVLIHAEAYMNYSELPMDIYLQAYTFAVAFHGIAFSVLLCFFDIEVLAMLKFPLKCVQFSKRARQNVFGTVQMHTMPTDSTNRNPNRDQEYQAVPQQVGELPADTVKVDT